MAELARKNELYRQNWTENKAYGFTSPEWYSNNSEFEREFIWRYTRNVYAYAVFNVNENNYEATIEEQFTPEQKELVDNYIAECAKKSEMERTDGSREKTGLFTGAYAINPVNGKEIPIYVADYVLISYGTGAIMAVPAHDERDYEFAKKFNLPIKQVIKPKDSDVPEKLEEAFTDVENGISIIILL